MQKEEIEAVLSQPRNLVSVNLNTREGKKASPIRLWCWKLH